MAALVGGFSKEMKATEEVQKIVDEVCLEFATISKCVTYLH